MSLKEQENESYDEFDPTYTQKGLKYGPNYKTDQKLVEKIEVLIKALGTMVLVPEYETSPDDFVKRYAGNVQKPILENEQRESTLKVLSELISQL